MHIKLIWRCHKYFALTDRCRFLCFTGIPSAGRQTRSVTGPTEGAFLRSEVSERMDLTNYLTAIDGVFYRAIDPAYRHFALSGSRAPGRYSDSHQPTLYLSSSPEGVEAAMQSHSSNRSHNLEIVRVSVTSDKIIDLRNAEALCAAGIDLNDAIAPWQEIVCEGGVPRSWNVRNRLTSLGIKGLIDPSRKAPGLWHLVLFSWNHDTHSRVALLE